MGKGMSIPVLICPCISRFDLLEGMLRSIDHPVDRIVIIDNSCADYRVPSDLESLPISYIRPVLNIGYPGGLNAGILQTPDAPWWMFCNADIIFAPGDLEQIKNAMNEATEARFVYGPPAYAMAALNREAVKRVGMFDAYTFYPAYFDDDDWDWRRSLAGVERVTLGLRSRHGDSSGGSLTIRSDERYRKANDRTFMMNKAKYLAKWGGEPGREVFRTPWNRDLPLWYIEFDIDGVRDKRW
jgi:GT2 family glycosyltransferase